MSLLVLLAALAAHAVQTAPVPLPPTEVARPPEAPEVLPPGVEPVAITPELLARWGIAVERYQALPENERRALQVRLTLGERRRLAKLERLRALLPTDWNAYVTPDGWITPEGLALLDAREQHLKSTTLAVPAGVKLERKDGKPLTSEDMARVRAMLDNVFDGTARLPDAEAGSTWVWDAQFRNETLHRLSATNPAKGLTLEVGQLGTSGPTRLIQPSWYGNVVKRIESDPDSWVDYRLHAQIGVVDMSARFFDDRPDPNIERAISLAQRLGASEADAAKLRRNLVYDDSYRARAIVVGSLMGELGRAYNLFGPVDFAWTVGGLLKMTHIAPNAAFDESAGLRIKVGEDTWLGVFAGATQNVSPIGSRILQDAMADRLEAGLNIEQAPHASVALWGAMPGMSDARYMVKARQQWARDLTATEVEGALTTTLLQYPMSLRGSWRKEVGYGGEYDRERLRAALEVELSPQAKVWAGVEKEKFRYGNAEMDWEAALLGIEITPGAGTRISADHVFGDAQWSHMDRNQLETAMRKVNGLIGEGLAAGDQAARLWDSLRSGQGPAQVELAVNQLSWALSRMGPESRALLLEELGRYPISPDMREALSRIVLRTLSPGTPYYDEAVRQLTAWVDAGRGVQAVLNAGDDASAWFREHRQDLADLARILTQSDFWESVLVNAGRAQLLAAIEKVEVPLIWGAKLTLDAPVLLAGVHILHGRPSGIAPLGKGEVDAWLLEQAGKSLGLEGTTTPDALLGRLLDLGENALTKALTDKLTPILDRYLSGGAPDTAAMRSALLSNLPSAVRNSLTSRYGEDLNGLLPPPGASAEQWKIFLSGRLPAELRRIIETEGGPALAAAIGEMVGWAGEFVRRELNMTILRMIVASEQLNRLTVDGGAPLADHSVRMMLSSFERMDKRGQAEAGRRLRSARIRLAERVREEDEALAARLIEHGKGRLSALQLDPSWPARLRIEVADRDWPALLSYYGDGPFFDLLDRMKAKAPALKGERVTVTFDFEGIQGMGPVTRYLKGGDIRVSLTPTRDARQGRSRLEHLDADLLERPR